MAAPLDMVKINQVRPGEYRSWVGAAVWLVTLGYGASMAMRLAAGAPAFTEGLVFGAALFSGWLLHRGHLRWVAPLLTGAVALDLHWSMLVGGMGMMGSATWAILVLITMSGLVGGPRLARLQTLAACVMAPSLVYLGGLLGLGPGLPEPFFVVEFWGVAIGLGWLMELYLFTAGGLIRDLDGTQQQFADLIEAPRGSSPKSSICTISRWAVCATAVGSWSARAGRWPPGARCWSSAMSPSASPPRPAPRCCATSSTTPRSSRSSADSRAGSPLTSTTCSPRLQAPAGSSWSPAIRVPGRSPSSSRA